MFTTVVRFVVDHWFLLVALVVVILMIAYSVWSMMAKWKLQFGLINGEELLVYQSRHISLKSCQKKAASLAQRYGELFSGATAIAPDGTETEIKLEA